MAGLIVNFNQVTLQCVECGYHLDVATINVASVPTKVLTCPNNKCANYNRYGQLDGSITLTEVFVSEAAAVVVKETKPPVVVDAVVAAPATPEAITNVSNLPDVNQPKV